jgi:hypothetical protein
MIFFIQEILNILLGVVGSILIFHTTPRDFQLHQYNSGENLGIKNNLFNFILDLFPFYFRKMYLAKTQKNYIKTFKNYKKQHKKEHYIRCKQSWGLVCLLISIIIN